LLFLARASLKHSLEADVYSYAIIGAGGTPESAADMMIVKVFVANCKLINLI